jgi:CRP/FNR family cyclic AMP-dependent transcriptional regulator
VIDASGFFRYPTEPPTQALPELLAGKSDSEWATFLAYTETVRFRRGEHVLEAGEADRALYLLVDGRLEGPGLVVEPVSTVGEGAFLDGTPRAVTLRAATDGELLRLGWDAFEALAAREPRLGRELLLSLGRILAARLRGTTNWTG